MKLIRIISTTAVLFLVLGVTVPVGAQKDKGDNEGQPGKQQHGQGKQQQHAQQQQGKGKQRQHAQQQEQGQARQQQHAQQKRQQATRPSQQERSVPRAQQPAVWQQHRARSWDAEHRTWQQRGGYSGYRIPEDRFRGYFGPSHGFRIYSYPVYVVGGFPRFRYGGFWFSLVDPWPEYWSDNWYQTDDVYIDYYDDGYYLYNRRHPGVRIAINVALG